MTETFSSRVTVAPDVLFRLVGDEGVLLNLKTELYLGLDTVGTRIWEILMESPSIETAYDALLREYDADPAQLRQDLIAFIDKLLEQKLIQVEA